MSPVNQIFTTLLISWASYHLSPSFQLPLFHNSVAMAEVTQNESGCSDLRLLIKLDSKSAKKGTLIKLKAEGLKDDKANGKVTYFWSASAGKIIGDTATVQLETSSVTRNSQIRIHLKAMSERNQCLAFSSLDITIISSDNPTGTITLITIGQSPCGKLKDVLNSPPAVTLNVGAVTPRSNDVPRQSATTVCTGDKVALQASAYDPDGDTLLYSWQATGGRLVGDGQNVTFDSTGLAPGEYTITTQVDDGFGCVAFDSKTIRVFGCPPLTMCFGPNTTLSVDKSSVNPGEPINLTTNGVTGGRGYGDVKYEWSATAGTIAGNGASARLDTTGVPYGTIIEVSVKTVSSDASCSASGSRRVSINMPPPPPSPPREPPSSNIPAFPWPPPKATADALIPNRWLPTGENVHLSDIADKLERALDTAKYPRWSYSSVPNGFALVSHIEQIKPDGTPAPARWSTEMPSVNGLNFLEYVRALLNAQPGYYRVIVFIVTDQSWSRNSRTITDREAKALFENGLTRLPGEIGYLTYGKAFSTTALVYEFKKASQKAAATLLTVSNISARDHLNKAGIADHLNRD